MSLRLDPKYHGVRVARVRPKKGARLLPSEGGSLLLVAPKTWFKFVRGRAAYERQWSWKEPKMLMVTAAIPGKLCGTHLEALEALGLR